MKCAYCDREAVVYCDYPFPVRRAESCDKPICPAHRKKVGHVCDRSRRTTNNRSDTIDHCLAHAEAPAPRIHALTEAEYFAHPAVGRTDQEGARR